MFTLVKYKKTNVKELVIGSCRRAWLSCFGADVRLLIASTVSASTVNSGLTSLLTSLSSESLLCLSMNVKYFKLFDLETTGTLTYGFYRLIAK